MAERGQNRALPRLWRILAVAAIHAAEISWAAWYMYRLRERGQLLGVWSASADPLGLLGQNLVESLVPLLLFLSFFILLKKDFADAMFLRLRGKPRRIAAAALSAVLLGIMAWSLVKKTDRYAVVYALFYYLVLIAFAEEFVTLGVCVWLLRDEDWPLRYLLPNVCFALIHLFSHADWGTITLSYAMQFLFTQVPGLVVTGCMMQLLKEKSGTIWLPVLLHAIMDYAAVLKY